ncbi:hypothetical protein H4R33_007101 [Dimargaris cristalligena]|nr:hypothetical protein H4R33_007101 [Dimargaris cristalligena]
MTTSNSAPVSSNSVNLPSSATRELAAATLGHADKETATSSQSPKAASNRPDVPGLNVQFGGAAPSLRNPEPSGSEVYPNKARDATKLPIPPSDWLPPINSELGSRTSLPSTSYLSNLPIETK